LMLFRDGRYPRYAFPVLAEYIRPNVCPRKSNFPSGRARHRSAPCRARAVGRYVFRGTEPTGRAPVQEIAPGDGARRCDYDAPPNVASGSASSAAW
jgi:hypothetical protein